MEVELKVGRVVLIEDSLKHKAQQKIGQIEGKVVGKDCVIRGYKVWTANGYLLERPVQLIADLGVGGESENTTEKNKASKLNPMAPEFKPQTPSRRSKVSAKKQTHSVRT